MRRAEDAKTRATQSSDARFASHPSHISSSTTHTNSAQQEAPRFVVQYEPCLSVLLQPDVRSSRALHKDYAPLSKTSTSKCGEGGEQHGDEADGDVSMEQRKNADEKKVISKGIAASRSRQRLPIKRVSGHSSPKQGQGGSKNQSTKSGSKAK